MNQAQYKRIEDLFEQALETTVLGGREDFVRAAEAELQPELRALLESYDSWTAKLPPPPMPVARRATHYGPYECLELVGSGGMGSVYRARRVDGQYQQEVAIKVLNASLQGSAHRARFATERQILASLNHPHIARLFDGGLTEEGEPYLVMEFVSGEAIHNYCDARQLTLEARIALFRQVLAAVDFAHRNLVVHLDLKPSNILVTPETAGTETAGTKGPTQVGAIKLLDFGTSKMLAEDRAVTRAAALTPAYASPEQLRGFAPATTADVFSLGAVLYELLAGATPHAGDGSYAQHLERALQGTGALPPETQVNQAAALARSTTAPQLRKRLAGDLSAILRKALEPDPALRYSSVAALDEDLVRWQQGRPVLARRQVWSYVARKALRRYRWQIAAAAIFVAGLTGALFYANWQTRLANRQAARAQAANTFVLELLSIPNANPTARPNMTVRELLDAAEARVRPALRNEPEVARDVEIALASGYALHQNLPRAREILLRTLQESTRQRDLTHQAQSKALLAHLEYLSGHPDPAWQGFREALSEWTRHPSEFRPLDAARLLTFAGNGLLQLRPYDVSHREYLVTSLALCRAHPEQIPDGLLAATLRSLGESYLNVDRRYAQAYPLLKEALAISRAHPEDQLMLLESLVSFGRVNRFLSRPQEDEPAQREAYEIIRRLYGSENNAAASQQAIWARSLAGVGRPDQAYAEALAALATFRNGQPPGSPMLFTNLSVAAYTACLTRRFAECESLAQETIGVLGKQATEKDARLVDARAYLAISWRGLGRTAAARDLMAQVVRANAALNRQPSYLRDMQQTLSGGPP